MPQPFKRRPGQTVKVSSAAVAERPAHGLMIALIASHWAKVEHSLSLAFTVMLSGQEPSAFEAYHELFDLNLRHKMFKAAARRRKQPADLSTEAEQIRQKARKVAGARATVVHGTWATCPDRPESLLLSNPIDISRKVDEFLETFHDNVEDIDTNSPEAKEQWSFDFTTDEFIEYTADDFNDILKRIIEIDQLAGMFWPKVFRFAAEDVRKRRQRRHRR